MEADLHHDLCKNSTKWRLHCIRLYTTKNITFLKIEYEKYLNTDM